MFAYQWEVFPYSGYRGDDLAKHSGITDSETTAIGDVERILKADRECAMGVIYPVTLVYSATRALSYEWAPNESGKRQFCTRTVRGGTRWLTDPVKAIAV